MNMNQFTQKSIEALRDMQSAALENGNQQIEQVHLLHALISKEDGLIPNLITKSGASLEDLRAKTEAAISALPKVSGMQADKLYISRELDSAFTEAEAQAKQIINTANEDAKIIRANAQLEAAAMVDSSEIVIQSKATAEAIATAAQEEAASTLAGAKAQAENIVSAATEQAERTIEDARTRSDEAINKANKWSAEIRMAAGDFVEDIMKTADETVAVIASAEDAAAAAEAAAQAAEAAEETAEEATEA